MYTECCKYRKAQKISITNGKRKKGHQVIHDCDYKLEEQITHKSQQHKKLRSRLSPEVKKYYTEIEKILLRIQPPLVDREKYINPRHVLCFLQEGKYPCPPTPKKKPCPDTQKSRKRMHAEFSKQLASNEKNNANGVKNEETAAENHKNKNDHLGEKNIREEQKDEKKNNRTRKNKRKKDKFWCPKVNKTQSTKPKEQKLDGSSDCKDTICSFDSEVYLAGCGLTKKDKEKIEKNREHNSRQFNKRNKNIHEDANTQETFNENKKSNDSTENPTKIDLTNDKDSKE